MVRISILFFTFIFLFLSAATGQETLSLDEAVRIALQNNFNVKIAINDAVINKTNNTTGNAGLLPEVALNFGNNYNINNTRQEFFSGDTREGNGVNTSNINANIQLGWTVFDGMRMFVNRDRLKEIESLGELNIKLQMENTVSQVMSVYYNIEQHQRRIETIQKAIEISKERYELASLKKNVGSGSGISVLQAKVDINADSSALIRQQLILKTSKIQLNEILGRSPEIIFDISTLTDSQKDVDFQELSEMAAQRNLMLQMADKNIRLSELNVKLWEGNKYPTIDLNLGYNFSRLKAEIGILKFNQNAGLSYGLTGRWNIFNGWNNKREIQVAKLGIETGKLTKEQTALSLKTDLFTIFNNYLTARELTKIEEGNIRIAEQNLDITTEKMRLGTIEALELRQAQLNLVDVEFRKITSAFEARMAHLELMRLSGQLLK
ncbi:MAG: TolC family protein [Saprospiraceae bacterium]|nr:TolC family protein [Saprospiraceae bacterium]